MSCRRCLIDNLKKIQKIGLEPCRCTEEQQVGTDVTVCRSCEASGILNEIADELDYRLGEIERKECFQEK